MKNFCVVLTLLFFLVSCASGPRGVVISESVNFASQCPKTGNTLTFTTEILINKNDQVSFFGNMLPENIYPVLVCISNGTDKTFGFNVNDLEFSMNAQGMTPLLEMENTPFSDETGSLSSAAAFVAGTAVIGLVPGLLFAISSHRDSSRAATAVSLQIKNKKLTSGLIHSNEVKVGFIYFESLKHFKLSNLPSIKSHAQLLDLKTKDKNSLVSSLKEYRQAKL